MRSQVPASRIKEDFGEPAIPFPESSSRAVRRAASCAAQFHGSKNPFEKG